MYFITKNSFSCQIVQPHVKVAWLADSVFLVFPSGNLLSLCRPTHVEELRHVSGWGQIKRGTILSQMAGCATARDNESVQCHAQVGEEQREDTGEAPIRLDWTSCLPYCSTVTSLASAGYYLFALVH